MGLMGFQENTLTETRNGKAIILKTDTEYIKKEAEQVSWQRIAAFFISLTVSQQYQVIKSLRN